MVFPFLLLLIDSQILGLLQSCECDEYRGVFLLICGTPEPISYILENGGEGMPGFSLSFIPGFSNFLSLFTLGPVSQVCGLQSLTATY